MKRGASSSYSYSSVVLDDKHLTRTRMKDEYEEEKEREPVPALTAATLKVEG